MIRVEFIDIFSDVPLGVERADELSHCQVCVDVVPG